MRGSTTIAGFSSRGPTADGRIKPDITAPGSNTISARGSTNVNARRRRRRPRR